MAKNLRGFLQAALIVLAGWWVFSPAFHGGWLWDDDSEITENPILRDPAGFWESWSAPAYLVDYFPLKTAVQWLQWQAWQNHTFGYHLTNVGLHLLSALLLWRLLRRLGVRLAWLGGLIFVLHPVMVESVVWIAELKNTLSLPLLLLAMGAWLDYDEGRRRTDYFRALLLFLAAMLCKSSVVMFPVILLLHAWWKRGRIAWADLKSRAAFFAVSLGLGLVTVWFQQHRSIIGTVLPAGGFFSRLACAGLALPFYFSKCVFPAGLLPIYPRWDVNPPSLLQFLPWPLLGAAFYALWTRRRAEWRRHVLFGCGFFVLNLAPVLGFVAMSYMRVTWVADHFLYLPFAGLAGLAAAGAGAAADRLSAPLRRPAFVGAALILGLLALQSRRYAGNFLSQEMLWTYTLERNPEAWLAHNNLGNVLERKGRLVEALGHYREALRLKPDSALAHYNLGNVLVRLCRMEEALEHYRKALRLNPDYMQAQNNLGGALLQMGRPAEAIEHYEKALRLQSGGTETPYTHYNLGNAFLQTGRPAEAARQYEKAVQLNPRFAEAHYDLGLALSWTGRITEAMRHFEEALQIKPDYAQAHDKLGVALVRAGRLTEALGHFERAVQIDPNDAEARNHLARLQAFQQSAGSGN